LQLLVEQYIIRSTLFAVRMRMRIGSEFQLIAESIKNCLI
jgi:hypothetical protein